MCYTCIEKVILLAPGQPRRLGGSEILSTSPPQVTADLYIYSCGLYKCYFLCTLMRKRLGINFTCHLWRRRHKQMTTVSWFSYCNSSKSTWKKWLVLWERGGLQEMPHRRDLNFAKWTFIVWTGKDGNSKLSKDLSSQGVICIMCYF